MITTAACAARSSLALPSMALSFRTVRPASRVTSTATRRAVPTLVVQRVAYPAHSGHARHRYRKNRPAAIAAPTARNRLASARYSSAVIAIEAIATMFSTSCRSMPARLC